MQVAGDRTSLIYAPEAAQPFAGRIVSAINDDDPTLEPFLFATPLNNFPALPAVPRTGTEPLHRDGESLGSTVLDFWRWSSSDLLANTTRGILAEFLVATALEIPRAVRVEWDAFDLVTPSGVRIEVKSAATWQAWAQKRPFALTFGIAPTWGWDAATNTTSDLHRRQANLYVFAVLDHAEKFAVDPLNVAQWTFYVVPAATLDAHCGGQKTIRLARLLALGARPVPFEGLRVAVTQALHPTL